MDRSALEAALVRLWRESTTGTVRNLAAALVVLCDFHRKHLDSGTIYKTWLRLDRTVRALPESEQLIAVHHADARALLGLRRLVGGWLSRRCLRLVLLPHPAIRERIRASMPSAACSSASAHQRPTLPETPPTSASSRPAPPAPSTRYAPRHDPTHRSRRAPHAGDHRPALHRRGPRRRNPAPHDRSLRARRSGERTHQSRRLHHRRSLSEGIEE